MDSGLENGLSKIWFHQTFFQRNYFSQGWNVDNNE